MRRMLRYKLSLTVVLGVVLLFGALTPQSVQSRASSRGISLRLSDTLAARGGGSMPSDSSERAKRYKLNIPDSLRATYLHTDGVKRLTIYRDSAGAKALFERALGVDSLYAPALYDLGSLLMEMGDSTSVAYARKAYLRDTTSRWYAALYAQSMVVEGKYDEALPLYRKLMRLDKNNPDYYRILAILYQQRRQPYSALAILDSADMRFGKMSYTTDLKRRLLIATRQFDRAIEEAQAAVDAAPYEQSNLTALGLAYDAAGKDSLAKVTLREAVQMDSTNVEALTIYADYCSKMHDGKEYMRTLQMLYHQSDFPFDKKVTMLKRFMEDREFYGNNYFAVGNLASTLAMHHPNEKEAVDLYGEHLVAGGSVELAVNHFKNHLQDEPRQLDYYMAVIDLEEYLQRSDSVDKYVVQAVQLFPEDPVLYIRRANREFLRGDLHSAVETFFAALPFAKNDAMRSDIWGYVGDTYHAMAERRDLLESGKMESDTTGYPVKLGARKAMKRCFASYEEALRLNPKNSSALNNYAYFLCEEGGDLEEALLKAERAIALEGSNATFLDTYAWILYRLERYEEARAAMRQAISLDRSKSATLAQHYGDILYALKEYFMAETYWRKALSLGADKAEIEERLSREKPQ